MASSRRRAIPRASSRPATLAQAISSTRPVAAASIRSGGRNGRPRSSRNEGTRVSSSKPGGRRRSAAARSRIVRTSVAACSVDTPGRRRPMPLNAPSMTIPPATGSGSGSTTRGVQSSVLSVGNSKPSERTPTMMWGSSLSSTGAPTNVRVRSEPVRPGAVAQQHDPVRAVDGIGVREDPAELRCCAQQREERGAHRRCGKVGRPVRPV